MARRLAATGADAAGVLGSEAASAGGVMAARLLRPVEPGGGLGLLLLAAVADGGLEASVIDVLAREDADEHADRKDGNGGVEEEAWLDHLRGGVATDRRPSTRRDALLFSFALPCCLMTS